MMKYITILLLLILPMSVIAQDTYFQSEDDAQLKQRAIEITDAYNAELGLRAKQELLVRKKIEEFLLREQKIKATYDGRERLEYMVALRKNEMAEMGDILTRIQMEKYKKVRPKIQPLDTVDKQ